MALYNPNETIYISTYIDTKLTYPYLMEDIHQCLSCKDSLYATFDAQKLAPTWNQNTFGNISDTEKKLSKYFEVIFRNFKCINPKCTMFCCVIDYPPPSREECAEVENFYRSIPMRVKKDSVYYAANGQKHALEYPEVYFHWKNYYGSQNLHVFSSIKRLPDISLSANTKSKEEINIELFEKSAEEKLSSLKDHGLLVSLFYYRMEKVIVPFSMFSNIFKDVEPLETIKVGADHYLKS